MICSTRQVELVTSWDHEVCLFSTVMFFIFIFDPYLCKWMAFGMNGRAGAPVLPPALMGPCREPGSATDLLMEAPNAEESGWKLLTASLESAQVS